MKSIREMLDILGDTPDEIAESLKQKGIKGEKENCYCCPLAEYLKSQGVSQVVVTDVKVKGIYRDTLESGSFRKIRDFVFKVDAGEYPDLLRNP